MLTIKTPTDLHQLPSNHSLYTPAKTLVERLIVPFDHPDNPYNADEEGFIVISVKPAIRTVPSRRSGLMSPTPIEMSPN